MGGGKPKEPIVTQVPTQNPQQQAVFKEFMGMFMPAIQDLQIGGAYGGPSESSYRPYPGEIAPTGGKDGGGTNTGGNRPPIIRPRPLPRMDRGRGEERRFDFNEDMMMGEDEYLKRHIEDVDRGANRGSVEERVVRDILQPPMPPAQFPAPPPSGVNDVLINPFTQPFTQGMTGNIPNLAGRRRGGRG